MNTKVVASDSAYKSCQLQLCVQKLSLVKVYAQFSMGIVHMKRMIIYNVDIKVINVYNNANEKVSIAIVHTLNIMHTKLVNSNNANKSCQLQQCIQKFFAYNSYLSFDAILRFFQTCFRLDAFLQESTAAAVVSNQFAFFPK